MPKTDANSILFFQKLNKQGEKKYDQSRPKKSQNETYLKTKSQQASTTKSKTI